MKYAIIVYYPHNESKYLKGFTNSPLEEFLKDNRGTEYNLYTVELKELSKLWIRLEGDAKFYLS